MCHSKSYARIVILGFLVLVCVLFTGSLYAQTMTKVAGKMTLEIVSADSLAVGDAEGHRMFLQLYEGTNANAGENDFMDGATLRNTSFSDMAQGNGYHQGYIEFTKEGSSTFGKWQGKITITDEDDGTKVTKFEGQFSFTGGTGEFEKIQGSGTYSGHFTSMTSITADWEGEIIFGK